MNMIIINFFTGNEMELPLLDFLTKREISNKCLIGPSITVPLMHLQRNNANPETKLYNLTKCINMNDISDYYRI